VSASTGSWHERKRTFQQGFVLEQGNLLRMLSIVEKAYEGDESLTFNFLATFQNERNLSTDSVSRLFEDNHTVKNPIRSLTVSATAQSRQVVRFEFDSNNKDRAQFEVGADDVRVFNDVQSQFEEQFERVLIPTSSQLSLIATVLGAAVAFLVGIIALMSYLGVTVYKREIPSTVTAFDSAARSARSYDEKLDAILIGQRAILRSSADSSFTQDSAIEPVATSSKPETSRALWIALPLLLIAGTLGYIIVACSPSAVFAWGDWERHYKALVARRRALWGVVIVSLFVGVIGNLFVIAVTK
jgi:hypothetical protein